MSKWELQGYLADSLGKRLHLHRGDDRWRATPCSEQRVVEERSVASLFSSGGTHALKGEFSGVNDFEVMAFLVVLSRAPGDAV